MTLDQEIEQLLAEVRLKKELQKNGYIHRDSLMTLVLERVRARFEELGVEIRED